MIPMTNETETTATGAAGNGAFEQVMDVCVQLLTKGVVLGARFSVGPYTPAVPTADGHGWAVLNLQGAPVVLAHDAYEAARAFLDCEDSSEWLDPDGPIAMRSDAAVAADADYERRYFAGLVR